MLCRDEAEVVDKLCDLGEKFNELYGAGRYAQAMFSYHEALMVAVFMEADRDIMDFLFGMGNTEDTDEKGLFDRDKVHRAHRECIRQDRSAPYVDAHDMAVILSRTVWSRREGASDGDESVQ